MATSPNHFGNSFTNGFAGASLSYGGIPMAQTPSHMSQASYQISVAGSPPSPSGFPLRQPYIGDSRPSPLFDDEIQLSPGDYLSSVGHGLPIIPVQSQYSDAGFATELNGLDFQPALTTASSSFAHSASILEELSSHAHLDAPGMVQIQSQNSFGDAFSGYNLGTSNGSVQPDTPAKDCTSGNVSQHMAFPNQWSTFPSSIPLVRTMTMGSSFEQDHSLDQAKLDSEVGQIHTAPAMERNGSSNRNLSQRMRERETAARHLSNADKNIILPKHSPGASNAAQAAAAVAMAHRPSASKTGSPGSGKMEIPKARRERPPHQRLYCSYCPDDTKGFRGPHELSRHNMRHHDVERKRYICVDPRPNGTDRTTFTVFKSLASCKKCSSRKQYGADYNAAAHLRRAHFKPHTPRAKGRSQPAQDDSSSLPAMDELKDWIVEITVPGSGSQPSQSPASVADTGSQPMGSLGLDSLFEIDDLDDNTQHYTVDSGLAFEVNQDQDQYSLGAYQNGSSSQPRGMTAEPIFTFDEEMVNSQFDYIYSQTSPDEVGSHI